MDVLTVLLQLLVGRGFVPVPDPGSPVVGGKPEGRRENEEKDKIRDKSGCGCTRSEVIKDMKEKEELGGRVSAWGW